MVVGKGREEGEGEGVHLHSALVTLDRGICYVTNAIPFCGVDWQYRQCVTVHDLRFLVF